MASKMKHAESHMDSTTSSKNYNKSVLDLFNAISNQSDSTRSDSCIALVKHLAGSATEVTDGNESKTLTYSLKRLVRGLGSTRQNIQKGYFTALVGVLEACSQVITYDYYFGIVEKELSCPRDASKGEEGEVLMGQVLACGAAIRGGLLYRSTQEQQKNIISTLLACSKKRSYLPFASVSFLHDLILNAEESVLVGVVWPMIKDAVSKPWQDQSLDTLLLLVSILNRVPHVVKSKKVEKWLGCQLLSSESMQHFAQKLVVGSTALTITHPIYEEFLGILCSPGKESLLVSFWTENVSSAMESSNRNKDLAALHCFTILLKHLDNNKEQIEMLLTPCILDSLKRSSRVLKGSPELSIKAQEVISSLGNAVSAEDVTDKIRLKVLLKILFESGNIQFERQTGTRLLAVLSSKLSKKSVQKLAKQFREVVDGVPSTPGQTWTNQNRKFAAQQLARLTGHQSCTNETDWKVEQLIFLLQRAIFRHDSVNAELAANIKQCFFHALDEKFVNLDTMIGVLKCLVSDVNDKLSNQTASSVKMIKPFSKEASDAWQKMWKKTSSLQKETLTNINKESATRIFLLLFLFMGLQLLSDPNMAIGALDELHSCYERLKSGKRVSKGSEEPQWIEVTVDLFLSLLSHDSHLLRTVISKVFPHLSKHLTVTAFYQILEVLDPTRIENPLTSAEDSDAESDGSNDEQANGDHSDGDDDDNSSDDENEDDDDNSSEDENEDDEFEDIDDEEDEEETINDKLRQEVRLALGDAAPLSDTESVDLDEIDEEEGQRMNAALAKAFKTLQKTRKSKKKKKQLKSDRLATHFRNRVLDLVDVYVTRDPSMDICLECITPLLSLLTFCMKDVHQKALGDKTKAILRKIFRLRKFSSFEGVSEDSLAGQIKSLVIKGVGTSSAFLSLSDLICECCTFLVRCSAVINSNVSHPEKPSPVAKVYETLLLDFFTKRSTRLSVKLFTSILNLHWSGSWHLAPLILQSAFDFQVHAFRRKQALEMLTLILSQRLSSSADKKQKQSLNNIVASFIENTIKLLNTSENVSTSKQKNQYTASVLQLVKKILTIPEIKPADTSALSAALASYCQRSSGLTKDIIDVLRPLSNKLNFDISMVKKVKYSSETGNKDASNEINNSDDDEEEDVSSEEGNGNMNGLIQDEEKEDVSLKKQNSGTKGSRKQEKKLQRLALMAEGLDSVTFSAVNDSILNGMEPDEEDNETSFSGNGKSKLNGSANSIQISPVKRKPKHSLANNSHVAKKKRKSN